MKYSIIPAAFAIVLLAGCAQSFKKAPGGLEYKIISDEKGQPIKNGYFFEIAFDQTYKGSNKDTVLFDSRKFYNQVVMLDSMQIPAGYYKIFSQIRKGDSIVIRTPTDTLIKQSGPNLPPFIKKGAYIIAHYKVLNIFETREAADSANRAQADLARKRDSVRQAEQLVKDDKIIKDYLAKNHIQAVKAPMGTYVEILSPGEGNQLDTSRVVKVNYTGRTMSDSKVFDSNTDTTFQHVEPFRVYLGAPAGMSVIKGWTDGLLQLKDKAKARFYIPSALGYGNMGNGERIKPDANLIFDIEVVSSMSSTEARAEADAQRKKMEAEQKAAMDAMHKAQLDSVRKKK